MPDTILAQLPSKEQAFESFLDPDRAAALCRRWDLLGDPVDRLRRQQRAREFAARASTSERRRLQALGRAGVDYVSGLLRERGYQVHPTTHKCPFDLWVADGEDRAARLEVKLSLYNLSPKGGRFQAHIHNDADLVVFIARNGHDWPFVIPMAAIAPRRNIAIWSPCPADYAGQWAVYLDAWRHLDQALLAGQAQAWQLALWGGDTGK